MTSISPQLPSCSLAPVPTGAERHLKLTQLLFIFTVCLWDKGDFEWDWTETHTRKLSGTKERSWGEGHFSQVQPKSSETSSVLISSLDQSHPLQYLFAFRLFRSFILSWSFLKKGACNSTTMRVGTRTWCCVGLNLCEPLCENQLLHGHHCSVSSTCHSCVCFPDTLIFVWFVYLFSNDSTFKNNRK